MLMHNGYGHLYGHQINAEEGQGRVESYGSNNTGAVSQHERANGCPSSIQIDYFPSSGRRPSLPESRRPEPIPKEEVIEWLKERDEVVSEATILTEGYYRCISCDLVGNVNKPMPLSNPCCPQCGTQSQVEKV
jgi:hypothetical protein